MAVRNGKGVIFYLKLESRDGTGILYLARKIRIDQQARKAINTAFSLLEIDKEDILINLNQRKHNLICGASLGLPIYLGMYALLANLKFKPKVFATGRIDKKGNIASVGCLAEKIKAVLGEADKLLVPKGQGLPIKGMEVVEIATLKEAIKIALVK